MISTKIYNSITALAAGSLAMFAPQRAAIYRASRDLYRTYAAGQLSGPNQNWRPRNQSADSEIRRGYAWVTARTRDQAQNNPHISGGIERICNNVVRSGIRPQFMFRDSAGVIDRQTNSETEALFLRWAKYADLFQSTPPRGGRQPSRLAVAIPQLNAIVVSFQCGLRRRGSFKQTMLLHGLKSKLLLLISH